MKTVNVIITVLVAGLLWSGYLLADAIYKRAGKSEVSLMGSLAGRQENKEKALPPTKAELDIREALENTARQSSASNARTETSPAVSRNQKTESDQPAVKKTETKTVRDARDVRVVMYVTDWCPYCKKARDFLNAQGVSLSEYNIERDRNAADEMVRKTGGRKGVPVIDIEGIIVRGFSPKQIADAIKQRQNG